MFFCFVSLCNKTLSITNPVCPWPVIRYGAPGVEFMGLHDENAAVTQVHFLPHQVQSEYSQQ